MYVHIFLGALINYLKRYSRFSIKSLDLVLVESPYSDRSKPVGKLLKSEKPVGQASRVLRFDWSVLSHGYDHTPLPIVVKFGFNVGLIGTKAERRIYRVGQKE